MGNVPAEAMLRDNAWHHMGVVKGREFTIEEVRAEGFGFMLPVRKVAMSDLVIGYECQDDEFANVRSDGLVVSSGMGVQQTPFQVEEGYEFGLALQGRLDARLVSIGELRNGRQWFLAYDLGEFFIGEHECRDTVCVVGSFDSSWPLCVYTSTTIPVCENTVEWGQKHGVKHYRFKFTSGIFDRVEQAVLASARHSANREAIQALGDRLVGTRVSDGAYRSILNKLFPTDEDTPKRTLNVNEAAKDTVRALYTANADGVDVVGAAIGSGFGLVQAVNTYENWGQPLRVPKGMNKSDARAIRQIDSVVNGTQNLTSRAIDLVLA